MKEFINFRPNVGYEGKNELRDIEKAIKAGFKSLREEPYIASTTRSSDIEETTPTARTRVQRIPTGRAEVEEEGEV